MDILHVVSGIRKFLKGMQKLSQKFVTGITDVTEKIKELFKYRRHSGTTVLRITTVLWSCHPF